MKPKSKEQIDQDKKILQDILKKENNDNEELKQQIEDMKESVKSTKLQLQEFLNKITDRETAVNKLNAIIDDYYQKINLISSYNKPLSPIDSHNNFNSNSLNNSPMKRNHIANNHIPSFSFRNDTSLFQRQFQNNKYKDYCEKQSNLLDQIANLRYEINSLYRRSNNKDYVIVDQSKLNLLDCFEKESVIKLAVALKTPEASKFYIVDKKKNVWALIRRKDLNETNWNIPQDIESKKRIDYEMDDITNNINNYIKKNDPKEEAYHAYDNNINYDEYDQERQSVLDMINDPNNVFY